MKKLTPEQIKRNEEFIKDLRENKIKTTGRMRDPLTGGRCCLCVAYDTAQRMGANLPEVTMCIPPDEIVPWYGWENNNPYLNNTHIAAAAYNDGLDSSGVRERSHAEIADMFQEWLNCKIKETA